MAALLPTPPGYALQSEKAIECPTCGQPELRAYTEAEHITRRGGPFFAVPNVQIGWCASCGESIMTATECERVTKVALFLGARRDRETRQPAARFDKTQPLRLPAGVQM
jgi:YgiT-type zinc finger domain-containing protein